MSSVSEQDHLNPKDPLSYAPRWLRDRPLRERRSRTLSPATRISIPSSKTPYPTRCGIRSIPKSCEDPNWSAKGGVERRRPLCRRGGRFRPGGAVLRHHDPGCPPAGEPSAFPRSRSIKTALVQSARNAETRVPNSRPSSPLRHPAPSGVRAVRTIAAPVRSMATEARGSPSISTHNAWRS